LAKLIYPQLNIFKILLLILIIMGQYYKVIILSDNNNIIRMWTTPTAYNCGNKLMEHSYLNNNFMNAMEYLISPNGIFYMSRIIWAGDYANPEIEQIEQVSEDDINLYHMAEEQYGKYIVPYMDGKCIEKFIENMGRYRYIVNHTKKLYVDKQKCKKDYNGFIIHPLSLLVTDNCNGMGGGDYNGTDEHLCGTWTRDIISVEKSIYKFIDYEELECNFEE
jgi:hypothetical protein